MAIREINAEGLTLVKAFEGLPDGDPTTVNLDPYLDPIGIWTIGYGHAIRGANGKYLRGEADREKAKALYPDGLTLEQAELLLRADMLDSCRDVQAVVKVPLSDNQFAALVSFEFNCGGLGQSTLLRMLNAGEPSEAVASQLLRWNRAGGKVLAGLTRRRRAEMDLFLKAA